MNRRDMVWSPCEGRTKNKKNGTVRSSQNVIESLHIRFKKVQVGKDQEKAQSEKDSRSKKREKTKLTIRYLYHDNIY